MAEVYSEVSATLHSSIKQLTGDRFEQLLDSVEDATGVSISYSCTKYSLKGSLEQIKNAEAFLRRTSSFVYDEVSAKVLPSLTNAVRACFSAVMQDTGVSISFSRAHTIAKGSIEQVTNAESALREHRYYAPTTYDGRFNSTRDGHQHQRTYVDDGDVIGAFNALRIGRRRQPTYEDLRNELELAYPGLCTNCALKSPYAASCTQNNASAVNDRRICNPYRPTSDKDVNDKALDIYKPPREVPQPEVATQTVVYNDNRVLTAPAKKSGAELKFGVSAGFSIFGIGVSAQVGIHY